MALLPPPPTPITLITFDWFFGKSNEMLPKSELLIIVSRFLFCIFYKVFDLFNVLLKERFSDNFFGIFLFFLSFRLNRFFCNRFHNRFCFFFSFNFYKRSSAFLILSEAFHHQTYAGSVDRARKFRV